MSFETIKSERLDNFTILLSLNRPEKINAMSVKMFEEIKRFVVGLEDDDEVYSVITRGEGGNFSSGLDFYDFYEHVTEKGSGVKEYIELMQSTFLSIFDSKKVFIAAVCGYCLGAGLDLISACDIRMSTSSARFSVAETRLGIVADLGSLQHLVRLIGEENTRYLAYTSDIITGEMAKEMGLVFEVCDTEEKLIKRAKYIADKVALNPLEAVKNTKKSINFSLFNPLKESMRYAAHFNIGLDFEKLLNNFSKNLK